MWSFIVNKLRATNSSISPDEESSLMDLAFRVLFHWSQTINFDQIKTELSVVTGTNQQMQSKCSCSTVIIPKPSRVNKQGQFPQISINATVEALKIRQNLTLRAHNSEAYSDWMERSQRKIHQKDELTWPAHILTCLPHVLSHVLALMVPVYQLWHAPAKIKRGGHFGVLTGMWFFWPITMHR